MSEKFAPPIMPREIKKLDAEHLKIIWHDGHESVYPHRLLRRECPCASCCEERAKAAKQSSPLLRVVTRSAPQQYVPTDIKLVGRYAVNIEWNDQHTSGIYSFKLLRKLCPCSACRPEGSAAPPHNEFGQVPEE